MGSHLPVLLGVFRRKAHMLSTQHPSFYYLFHPLTIAIHKWWIVNHSVNHSQCAVIGCSNADYKLSRWNQEESEIHKVLCHNVGCTCEQLFK